MKNNYILPCVGTPFVKGMEEGLLYSNGDVIGLDDIPPVGEEVISNVLIEQEGMYHIVEEGDMIMQITTSGERFVLSPEELEEYIRVDNLPIN